MLALFFDNTVRESIISPCDSIIEHIRAFRVTCRRSHYDTMPDSFIFGREEEFRLMVEICELGPGYWSSYHHEAMHGRIMGIPFVAVSEEEYQWERIRPASHRSPFLPSMGRRLAFNPRGYRLCSYQDGTVPTETTGVYEVYARHGGHKRSIENTKAMKMNPLVQQDERDRKAVEGEGK